MYVLPMRTHEERMAAIEAYPRAVQYAAEGNPFYVALVLQTQAQLAAYFMFPWAHR